MELLKNSVRNDLIITAIEGGSNYWYWLNDVAYDIIDKYKCIKKDFHDDLFSETFSEAILTAVVAGEKIPVSISDIEENKEEILGYLSKESIEKGEQIMYEKYPKFFADILNESWDAETADIWFQLCIMGELVFG
jgi:hypothetical protein